LADNFEQYNDGVPDDAYEVFHVDTDVSEVQAFVANGNCFGGQQRNQKPKSSFLPRDEWDKLTQDQKDQLIAKHKLERLNGNNGNRQPYQPA